MLQSSRSVRSLIVLVVVIAGGFGSARARAGAPPSYDATGVWHLVIADQRSGEVYDDVDTLLTQQPGGTITFCGECEGELFTLTPRGAGKGSAIPYELAYFGEGSPCNASGSGAVVLDTRNDSIKAHGVHVTSDDCSRLIVTVRLTRTTP